MSDIRLRIVTLTVLSVSVFLYPISAACALLWWLFFSGLTLREKGYAVLFAFAVSAFPTLILFLSGSAGAVWYGAKIFVLLLLAFWFGKSCSAGEMQSFFVWLLGNRTGFDIGMACEIFLMQTAEIFADAKGYRQALSQKGMRPGVRTLLPFSFGVLISALRRGERFGKVLARRGYAGGGSYTPEFSGEKMDAVRLFSAAVILLLGILV